MLATKRVITESLTSLLPWVPHHRWTVMTIRQQTYIGKVVK
jgi:hypothetical protein